ncbi:MAG: tetratricopeptide repeat protein [Flavobacteriales bacterium]|nr:tetratricopeptide repeat protein [Flavobacteriales bacterium]
MKGLTTLTCLLAFIGASLSFSPDPRVEIDSLTARLQEELHDTVRVNTLIDLAWEFMYTNPDTGIIISSEALANAEASEWQFGIAQGNGQLGVFSYLKGDFPQALEYQFKALKMNKELGRKVSISSNLGNIGIVYKQQGDYPKALEYYFQSLKMDEELGVKNGIAANLSNIALIYSTQGDYPNALKHYFKALNLYEELDNKAGMAVVPGLIGIVYLEQEDYPKALEYFLNALKLNEDLGNKSYLAGNLINIAGIYYSDGNYPKALEYSLKALEMGEELGDKLGISGNLGNIGSLYTRMGEFKKAENTLQKALSMSKEIGAKENLKNQYENLSNLYDTTNRPTQAFEAYKLHISYRDSIDNEENTKAQTRTEMKYEYEKAQLVKEQEEKEIARVLAEATSRRDNLQYSIVLICLLVIGLIVAMLGRLSLPIRLAEGLIFFAFLILFEFILVLADPYVDNWTGGAPGLKLMINACVAALIFPLHAFFEAKLKGRLVKL